MKSRHMSQRMGTDGIGSRARDRRRAAAPLLRTVAALVFVLATAVLLSCQESNWDLPAGLYAEMVTTRGTMVLELEYEKTPLTVASFVGLAEGTIDFENRDAERYYDGLTFHRVVDDFVVQGGDPRGDGSGGPGYRFPDEIHPELEHDEAGTLSMANSGPNTNGSQFFITLAETPWLDGFHTVFGRLVEGMDVLESIKQGDKIEEVNILRVGSDAKEFEVDQEAFDRLARTTWERVESEAAEERKAALALIEEKWPNAVETETGLQYVVDKKGAGGGTPEMGQEVTVHYVGMLLDGTVFDSSLARNEPARLRLGQVIPGWNEALVDMRRGEKRTLIVPPELGYGERGYPGVIPPNAFLVFVVELLDF